MISLKEFEKQRIISIVKGKTQKTQKTQKAKYVVNKQDSDDDIIDQEEKDQKALSQQQNKMSGRDDDMLSEVQQKTILILLGLLNNKSRQDFEINVKKTITEITSNLVDQKREDFINRSIFTSIQIDPIFGFFHENWFSVLENDHFAALKQCYVKAYSSKTTLPTKENIFNIFHADPLKIKCIILGQDPYPGRGKDNIAHACGYSFASRSSTIPQSLKPIFILEDRDQIKKKQYLVEMKEKNSSNLELAYESQELYEALLQKQEREGTRHNLKHWIDNGFFLANTILSIEEGKIKSHDNIGWQDVMKRVFIQLNKRIDKYCVISFGSDAQKFICCFGRGRHFSTKHPSAINRSPQFAEEFYNSSVFFNTWKYFIDMGVLPPC